MNSPTFRLGGVLAVVALATSRLGAAVAADAATLHAELSALERELGLESTGSNWDASLEAELGVGYRSNPTLAAFDPQESAVTRATVDVFAWRLPVDGFEWINLFDATSTHFFSGGTKDSWLAVMRSEARWEVGTTALWTLAGQYTNHDEVIDASTLDNGFGSARAQVQAGTMETKWKWRFAEDWNAMLLARAEHDDFRAPLDDFQAYRGGLTLERGLGRFGTVGATLGYMRRVYATREQAADGGRLLPDTHLRIGRPEIELKHQWRGGEKLKWRTTTTASYKENRDNGSGWYDYRQAAAEFAVTLEGKNWSLETELGWLGYLYRLQRSGFGDPPRRAHDDWTWFIRYERVLTPAWTAFVELELERSQSNDPFLVYDDALTLVGVRWSR